jgi:2-methylcitrate dehydratase PrpD
VKEGVSARLCRSIEAMRYEDLPPAVVETVKRLVLDVLGLIGGGASAPGIPELNARLSRWEAAGSATGLVGKRRYSPPTAALANGAAAHALDFDDLHDRARVHTSAIMLPTLLAAAEDIGGVSGRQFILAMAIGAELHARFGLACYNSLAKGWHPTMVFGTLSAGIAAGKMLLLNGEGLGNALGMAFHQASGSAQSMRDGVLSKRLGAGFAARAAVLAAFLAKDGLTGTRRTLEGDAGLFALYERGEADPQQLLHGLGETWQVRQYSFKPFPGCRCNHTVIGLGIRMHRDGIRAADVAKAEIRIGKVNWLSVGGAYDVTRRSVVHAQFNAAYSFARALADGKVDLWTYEQSAIEDPAIAALAGLIRVVDDPQINPQAIEPARVTLQLRDGRRIEASSDTMQGSPNEPMSEEQFEAKFHACLEYGLRVHREQAERLLTAVRELDSMDDVAQLLDAFPAAVPATED